MGAAGTFNFDDVNLNVDAGAGGVNRYEHMQEQLQSPTPPSGANALHKQLQVLSPPSVVQLADRVATSKSNAKGKANSKANATTKGDEKKK